MIRKQTKVEGTPCQDFCYSCLCNALALAQEARHLDANAYKVPYPPMIIANGDAEHNMRTCFLVHVWAVLCGGDATRRVSQSLRETAWLLLRFFQNRKGREDHPPAHVAKMCETGETNGKLPTLCMLAC
jgi:hypothetical protein